MASSAVKLGLIGTKTSVIDRVAADLQRQEKLVLSEIYDPCLHRAAEMAKSSSLSHSPSLEGLLRQTSGIIVADVRWMGVEPMVRAAGLRKPALILASVLENLPEPQLVRLHHFADLTGTLFMPELRLRWARSTLRLRELTATHLQPIQQLEISTHSRPGSIEELMLFDWCRNVIQSDCLRVMSGLENEAVELQFWRKQKDGTPITARIRRKSSIDTSGSESNSSGTAIPHYPLSDCQIRCGGGEVRITGEESLCWRQKDQEEQVESLQSDRTGEDLMYDLFGRRLVGGLVPVPDLRDLLIAHAIRRAMEQSDADGEPVSPVLACP